MGALYLVYLGVSLLRSRTPERQVLTSAQRTNGALFRDGAVSNIANPKIAIFYFAFLPQFVSPGAAHPTLSILALGVVFALVTFLIKGPVGVFAGRLSGGLRSRPVYLLANYRLSGITLVGLGARLAFKKSRSSGRQTLAMQTTRPGPAA